MRWSSAMVLVAVANVGWAAAPPAKTRDLTAAEQREVAALDALLDKHANDGAFEQAAKVAQQIADYRRGHQGVRHWQAIDARFAIEEWKRLAAVAVKDRGEVMRARRLNGEGVALLNKGRFRDAEKPLRQALLIKEKVLGLDHPSTATSYNNVAACLGAQGKAAEALPLYRKALLIREKVLGPDHPDTAGSYNNVAACLESQGKATEALPLFRKGLLIREKVLGPDHPDTATSYNNVAYCLEAQGKAAEALPLYRQALRIHEKVLGLDHPSTATSYSNVASCLQAQGKAAEALPLYRKALRINEKVLGPDHPSTALSYNNVAMCLNAQGKAAEALSLYRKALLIKEKVLGPDHPSTATSYNNVAYCLQDQGKAAEALPLFRKALLIREKMLGLEHPDTAQSYNGVAACLQAQGKAAEALPLFRKALLIHEKVLGLDHPDTAGSYNNVAYCLQAQGKPAEALPLFRKALRIREKVLGLDHPDTADSYNGVAACLQDQGKAAEALPLYRKALLIREKVLGRDHPATATSYNNVALCLQAQGKAAQALPLYRQALLIREKVLGLDHPGTAASYNNLAYCLHAQGKAAQALPLFRKALLIREKVLGPDHRDTAESYNNVAACLEAQGKAAEALPLFRKALRIHEKVLGLDHRDTANSYNNVAYCLDAQGKAAEALPLYRKALRISEKVLGPDHPSTALSYNNVACCLHEQGKAAEALPLYRQALLIFEKVLGLDHPCTATSYNNVAFCLWQQERRNEAVLLWQQSLRGQEAARAMRADTGFERAQATRDISVQAALAVGLAQLKQPRNAFRHAEASLGRGLLDDLAGLSQGQRDRAADLRVQMAKREPILASFSSREELTEEQKARQETAKGEYGQLWRELSDLFATASERAMLPLERIQKSIPDDAALVLWITELGERWGCVVRSAGLPRWQKLDNLTEAKAKQAAQLYMALIDPSSNDKQREQLLTVFRKERLDPLRPHLKGVNRLFVVPTGVMAYIPADLLAEGFAVRYVPSGSVLARTMENHRALDGTSLLALGDPIFDKAPPAEPPTSGVFVQSVLPNTFAAKAGLQSGDVLLSIGSTKLASLDDLKGGLSSLPATADVWREGKTFAVRLQGSPLGVVLDQRSARAAVGAWRRDREAVAQRGTGHKRLPGTRLEVEAIAALVKGSARLLGSAASEQRLDALLDSGKLKSYRLLHFATHGEADAQIPKRSALILAQDDLPDPVEQVKADKHAYDGKLTVERIREHWQLDADLVVLSACETGLGKEAKGDGLLGFAQAFLSKGARSVVLSRWKVDDTATSLLMIRFYENLLASRKGTKPMGRATALDEAKQWLRTLPRREAERLATLHTGGVLRGSEGIEKTPDKGKRIEYKGDTPFAHPYYWAAFTLIGDPD